MKPVDQTTFYDPENPGHGNCQQAALASLFGIPLEDAPIMSGDALDGPEGSSRGGMQFMILRKWAAARGFELYERHATEHEMPDGSVARGTPVFRGYYIATGPSSRGVAHCVIYKSGKLAHDPHPSRAGIEHVETAQTFVPLDFEGARCVSQD